MGIEPLALLLLHLRPEQGVIHLQTGELVPEACQLHKQRPWPVAGGDRLA